jgi:hypothetical protein
MQLLSLGNNNVKLSCGCIIYLKIEEDLNLVDLGLIGIVLDEAKVIQCCNKHTKEKIVKQSSEEYEDWGDDR